LVAADVADVDEASRQGVKDPHASFLPCRSPEVTEHAIAQLLLVLILTAFLGRLGAAAAPRRRLGDDRRQRSERGRSLGRRFLASVTVLRQRLGMIRLEEIALVSEEAGGEHGGGDARLLDGNGGGSGGRSGKVVAKAKLRFCVGWV